jgi:hypothetical protein
VFVVASLVADVVLLSLHRFAHIHSFGRDDDHCRIVFRRYVDTNAG